LKEYRNFIAEQSKQLEKVASRERSKIFTVPRPFLNLQAKKDLSKTRRTVMRRTLVTQANAKRVSEWTIPKMLEKANKAKLD